MMYGDFRLIRGLSGWKIHIFRFICFKNLTHTHSNTFLKFYFEKGKKGTTANIVPFSINLSPN